MQGTHGCAELCFSHDLPLCCHCFSGNHASHSGLGAGRLLWPPGLTGQTFSLQWHCSHSYCIPPKCISPQIPTKEHWVAWDVCRPFLGLQFVPPRAEVVMSGGLGQLHTLLATSAQSLGAVVVTLGIDHEKCFQHLSYAAQLLSFCISVSLDTEER